MISKEKTVVLEWIACKYYDTALLLIENFVFIA